STPGDSLRSFFSSQAAAMRGSQNLAGMSDPVIDALIEKIIAADNRAYLTHACRALDRVIRSGRYWVPHWYKASHWLAYWNVFSRPATKPRYARRSRDLVVRSRKNGEGRSVNHAQHVESRCTRTAVLGSTTGLGKSKINAGIDAPAAMPAPHRR